MAMVGGKTLRVGIAGALLRWAARLRFPWLLAVTAGLFLLNLVVPDPLPFADELLLGLVTLVLANLRKKKPPAPTQSST